MNTCISSIPESVAIWTLLRDGINLVKGKTSFEGTGKNRITDPQGQTEVGKQLKNQCIIIKRIWIDNNKQGLSKSPCNHWYDNLASVNSFLNSFASWDKYNARLLKYFQLIRSLSAIQVYSVIYTL